MATETQLPEKFSTRERYRADILAVFEGLVHDATMRGAASSRSGRGPRPIAAG